MQILSLRKGRALVVVILTWCFFAGSVVETALGQESGKKFVKEIVAVLDLKATGAGPSLALAASIRLREELLKSGFFKLVDRQQLKQVLDEQAFSQATCLGGNCNIQVGKITGARIIMTGDLVQLSEDSWQISTLMTDVETSEVLRTGSLFVEGSSADLINEGIPQLVGKMIPKGNPEEYGGVVNFLMQTSADLVKDAASGLLGMEQDEKTGTVTLKADNRIRIWVSPLSTFRYAIRDKKNHHLEYIHGNGISLALEREIENSWVVGGAVHMGALEEREDESDSSNLILGYYSAWSLYALDAVPNGRPWFYYGTGLFGYSLNYTDRGENLNAEGTGALLMGRFMYTFDAGAVIGMGMETNYLFSLDSKGTRINQLKAAGKDVSPHAWGALTYLFIGDTF